MTKSTTNKKKKKERKNKKETTGCSSQRVGRTKGLSFSLGSAANKRCSLGLSLKFDGQTFFHLHN